MFLETGGVVDLRDVLGDRWGGVLGLELEGLLRVLVGGGRGGRATMEGETKEEEEEDDGHSCIILYLCRYRSAFVYMKGEVKALHPADTDTK